jgi:hypothetical protein
MIGNDTAAIRKVKVNFLLLNWREMDFSPQPEMVCQQDRRELALLVQLLKRKGRWRSWHPCLPENASSTAGL